MLEGKPEKCSYFQEFWKGKPIGDYKIIFLAAYQKILIHYKNYGICNVSCKCFSWNDINSVILIARFFGPEMALNLLISCLTC